MLLLKKISLFCLLLLCPTQLATAAIQGLYGTDCMEVAGMSAVNDLYFDQGEFEMVQTVFRDSNCEEPAYDLSLKGSYTLPSTGEVGAMDFTFKSARLSPLAEDLAAFFQEQKLCGRSDWRAQESLDVAGLVCGEQKIPANSSKAFDRVEETLEGLRLGLPDVSFDGSSPERRPQTSAPILYKAR